MILTHEPGSVSLADVGATAARSLDLAPEELGAAPLHTGMRTPVLWP